MKLLICTQKVVVNDPVLGFFHRWLEEFAKHCEKLTVICLEKGEYDLPQNVKVLCLGKEVNNFQFSIFNFQLLKKINYLFNFYYYIWKCRKEYERVFVHMNPEYIVLGGWLWRLMGKKINLWYVHRQVNFKLRIAAFFADKIFSVSPESFGLKNKKVSFVGHGIDIEFFKCGAKEGKMDKFKIISVGRITKIKNLDALIEAVGMLSDEIKRKISVEIVGGPVTDEDKDYLQELRNSVKIKQLEDVVKFTGSVLHHELVSLYCQSHLLINLCPTGGIDKVVLEAMSCGLLVLVSNKSFLPYLNNFDSQLLFEYQDCEDLAYKIQSLLAVDKNIIGSVFREHVVTHHELKISITKLVGAIN